MTAPTHKQYAIAFAFIANMMLFSYNITNINYYLALPIILLTSKYGALFPDVDHSWKNVKDKSVPNWIINKIIHLTGGSHRSWQTHSIDIVVIVSLASYYLPSYLYTKGLVTVVNREVLSILMLGFSAGWISHIIADMFTSAGVRLLCFLKLKVKFVPKQLFGLRFNTGNEWEQFCYKLTRFINIILGIICLIYPLIVNGTISNLIDRLLDLF